MITDFQTLLSNVQAITVAAPSTNVYDTGSTADDGPGTELKLFASNGAAFASTSLTMAVSLQTAVDAAFTTPIELWTHTVLATSLIGNQHINLPNVPNGAKRYLRLYYTPSATATAGDITAGIVLGLQANISTSDGLPPMT